MISRGSDHQQQQGNMMCGHGYYLLNEQSRGREKRQKYKHVPERKGIEGLHEKKKRAHA